MRTEIYEKDAPRFITELKRAKVEKIFYLITEPKLTKAGTTEAKEGLPAREKLIAAYSMIISSYIGGAEPVLMRGNFEIKSNGISTQQEYDDFIKAGDDAFESIKKLIQEECPEAEIFGGIITVD